MKTNVKSVSKKIIALVLSLFLFIGMFPITEAAASSQADDIVSVAESQIGTVETGTNNVKYNTWYYGKAVSGSAYPWCAVFVAWCANQAGISSSVVPQTIAQGAAGCDEGMRFFQNQGRFYNSAYQGGSYTPKKGDIIYFSSYASLSNSTHVGIVTSCSGGTVYTVEGNKSDSVARGEYSLSSSYIVGYGVPNYSGTSVTVNPSIYASVSSVNLNRSQGETQQITVTYENYDGTPTISYSHGDNRVSNCTWGDWSGNSVPLTIEGYTDGTETLSFYLLNSDTEAVLASTSITVTVTSDPLVFECDNDEIVVNEDGTASCTFSYKNCDDPVTISFEHGNDAKTSLSWSGWSNNKDTLNITGISAGKEDVKVSLKSTDTGEILASKTIHIVVSGIETSVSESSISLSVGEEKKSALLSIPFFQVMRL